MELTDFELTHTPGIDLEAMRLKYADFRPGKDDVMALVNEVERLREMLRRKFKNPFWPGS